MTTGATKTSAAATGSEQSHAYSHQRRGERRMSGKLGFDARGVADQEEARLRVTDQHDRRGGNDHAWPVVPAHGVERYGDWSTHFSMPFRKSFKQRSGRGNPRE